MKCLMSFLTTAVILLIGFLDTVHSRKNPGDHVMAHSDVDRHGLSHPGLSLNASMKTQDVLTAIASQIDSVTFDQPIDLNELKSHQKKQSRWVSKLFKVFDEAEENQEKMSKLEKVSKKLQPCLWKAWTKATKKESYRRLISKQLSKYSQDPRIQSRPHLACALQQLQCCLPKEDEAPKKLNKRSFSSTYRGRPLVKTKCQADFEPSAPYLDQLNEPSLYPSVPCPLVNPKSAEILDQECILCYDKLSSREFGKYYKCQDSRHQIHKECHLDYVKEAGHQAMCPFCRSPPVKILKSMQSSPPTPSAVQTNIDSPANECCTIYDLPFPVKILISVAVIVVGLVGLLLMVLVVLPLKIVFDIVCAFLFIN